MTEVHASFDAVRRLRLYHRIQVAARSVQRLSDQAMLEATGLTTAQVAVLSVLTETGAASQREIAERLEVREPAVTQMIRRLEGQNCVSRQPDPADARARAVSLTDRGQRVRAKSALAFQTVNDRFAAALSDEEIEILVSLLQRVRNAFEREAPR